MNNRTPNDLKEGLRQANSCLALGAGLGAVSAASALVAGTTCPLCLVLAPALMGIGAWKRYQVRQAGAEQSTLDKNSLR